ncbi:MAG: alpha-mannosidase [bacterium]|nr:alpha-mannosidase [bacterium]
MHAIRMTVQKITRRLELIAPLIYREKVPLAAFRYQALDSPLDTPPTDPDFDDSTWPLIEPGASWGQRDTNFVLRGEFRIPPDWDANTPAALYLPIGDAGDFLHPEALVYVDGVPFAAVDRFHQELLLSYLWRDQKMHSLALHGYTSIRNSSGGDHLRLNPCSVVLIDQPTRNLYVTAKNALDVAGQLDDSNPVKSHLLNALDEAFKLLDTREPFGAAFYASVEPALSALQLGIAQAGQPYDVNIIATGHAHIDVAWLWTLGQTRRKAARTFYTVLRLMEQFPDYHFTQSQPQLYDYMRQDHPDLLESIKTLVSEGRWEPIGGMWVEADCNITGSESLARQFLLGRTFFREHFGFAAESPVLWLPDVFGYAWNLPQLIRLAGLDYFFTIKIGWNQYNRLPYDSFWWQGLDGTRVLTHFSTVPEGPDVKGRATYNARPEAWSVLGAWRDYQQKEHHREILMSYGWGDGGGGPTREMLENIEVFENFPSVPRVRSGSVIDFFRRLDAEAGAKLPTWNGELYLEIHRGTYTTQSRNKRANRKSEFLLHDAEFLAAVAAQLDSSYTYPTDTFRKAWELVCLNQFHDIIPGSSIGDVYVESQQQYAEVRQMAESARDSALAVIRSNSSGDLLVVNPTGFARDDLAFWPGQLQAHQRLLRADGEAALVQITAEGTWIDAGTLPPYSINALRIESEDDTRPDTGLTATPSLLENRYLRVELNEAGDITRLYDKENEREVLPAGAIANQWLAFEDRPTDWDAWDIDIHYDDRVWYADPAQSVQVVESGPLRATIEVQRQILNSRYTQRISFMHNSPRLDFETVIDWRERHILLKTAFPVDVLSPTATYEIQWGNVQRPTHRNTSWDWARFETCAQKWVDLSEGGYGVSLLNDCKHGHDIRDNVIRLSLLRAPTDPDRQADQGEHRFTYSLFPHSGGWNEQTIAAAYALNDPLLVVPGATSGNTAGLLASSFVATSSENIVIETVKQAEDGNGVIVRLYESQRKRGEVVVTTAFTLADAEKVNLLEEPLEDAAVEEDGRGVRFHVRPYEIVTLRLIPTGT